MGTVKLIEKVGAETEAKLAETEAKLKEVDREKVISLVKKIPGTLGGMIKMNAGVKEYEISNLLLNITTSKGVTPANECGFSYRHSNIAGVIFEASFKIMREFDEVLSNKLNQKRSNQPKGASFGSCFANPAGDHAGRLLEAAGMKEKSLE